MDHEGHREGAEGFRHVRDAVPTADTEGPGAHHAGHSVDATHAATHAGHSAGATHAGHSPGATHAGHSPGTAHAGHSAKEFGRRFWICLALTVPVLALSPSVQSALSLRSLAFAGDRYVLFGLSSVVFFYGGMPFLRGMASETRGKRPGMMTLIAIAISVAYLYSAAAVFGLTGDAEMTLFWELATLIDVMLLGHWLEMRSVSSASKALEELARLLPAEAHLVLDGAVKDVPLGSLEPGDLVQVRPGEKVPVDGEVVDGETTVDESMLTGESMPVHKSSGAAVTGGSLNGEGALEVLVKRTGADTYLSQVAELVRNAQGARSRTRNLADRAALWLTVGALAAAGATLAYWLAAGATAGFAVERTVSVMVIACPHALGLAIPLVVTVSTGLAASSGLLIKDRDAFETARGLQAVVFDKTGTLTEGRFAVGDVASLSGGYTREEVLGLAAAVESMSEHPVGRAIVEEARARGIEVPPAAGFRAVPGRGAAATVAGKETVVASPGYLDELGVPLPGEGEEAAEGLTRAYVLRDGEVVGAVWLSDAVRPESRQAVEELEGLGMKCMMLTGDSERAAAPVARELGIKEYFARVLPHQKAQKVEEVKRRGLAVAMVGDGVNDAPALAAADVGIAVGAGTDVAIASADVVLVRDDPRGVVEVVRLSEATRRKMVQNLAWATGYNVFAIPAAAGVLYPLGIVLTPALGAIFMSLSTIIVAVNARLLRSPRQVSVRRRPSRERGYVHGENGGMQ